MDKPRELVFEHVVTEQAYTDYKWPMNVTVSSRSIWVEGARWQFLRDKPHADAQAARIAELEGELELHKQGKVIEEAWLEKIEALQKENAVLLMGQVGTWQVERDQLQARLGEMTAAWEQAVKVAVDRERQIAELTAELDALNEYKEHVYSYVQGTGNTSPKTLGYHVAKALVMDHQDLKAKLAAAEAEIKSYDDTGRKQWYTEKMQGLYAENASLRAMCEELAAIGEKLMPHHQGIHGHGPALAEVLAKYEAWKAAFTIGGKLVPEPITD